MISFNLEALVKSITKKILMEYPEKDLDPEDLMSQGYLIATEQMKNFRGEASLSTFMYSQIYGRLKNYVNRQELKASHGNEQMQRVSMEHVDSEISISTDNDMKILLDDFKLSLETEEAKVFDMMRAGYSYREISKGLGISTGTISNMVSSWRDKGASTV